MVDLVDSVDSVFTSYSYMISTFSEIFMKNVSKIFEVGGLRHLVNLTIMRPLSVSAG